jgi:hypothetical protein
MSGFHGWLAFFLFDLFGRIFEKIPQILEDFPIQAITNRGARNGALNDSHLF